MCGTCLMCEEYKCNCFWLYLENELCRVDKVQLIMSRGRHKTCTTFKHVRICNQGIYIQRFMTSSGNGRSRTLILMTLTACPSMLPKQCDQRWLIIYTVWPLWCSGAVSCYTSRPSSGTNMNYILVAVRSHSRK